MPSVLVRVPRADLSAYGKRPFHAQVKAALLACIGQMESPASFDPPGDWLIFERILIWLTDDQAESVKRFGQPRGVEAMDVIASCVLHSWARAQVDPNDASASLPDPPPAPKQEAPAWCLRLVSGGDEAVEVVRMLFVGESDKARRVETAGGAIWLPKPVVKDRIIQVGRLDAFLAELMDLTRGEEQVRLYSVKTSTSGRVRATVITAVPAVGEVSACSRRRQIWLGSKFVSKVGRDSFAPRWIVVTALKEAAAYLVTERRSIRFATNETLPLGSGWAGMGAVEHALRLAMDRLQARSKL